MSVANAPGKKIYPGELKKGLDLLAKGKAIDYEGATAVKFTDVGEHVGNFIEKEIKGGKFKNKNKDNFIIFKTSAVKTAEVFLYVFYFFG